MNQYGRIRDVCVGPANEIYFATNGNGTGNDANTHSIFVLKPVNVVSVSENLLASDVRIFPNPANDLLSIDIAKASNQNYVITITDLIGKTLIQAPATEATTSLDIGQLSKGVYLFSIEEKGTTVYRSKIIKN